MRITREQDFVFTDEVLKGSVHAPDSAVHQIADLLRKFGVGPLQADVLGRALGDLFVHTGDGGGYMHAGDLHADWCADQDGTMKVTLSYTTVE